MSKSTGAPDAIELEAILDEAEVVPSTAVDRLRISVLSSFGRALLGARVGDVINASFADIASGKFRVAELVYQPEAAGRCDL